MKGSSLIDIRALFIQYGFLSFKDLVRIGDIEEVVLDVDGSCDVSPFFKRQTSFFKSYLLQINTKAHFKTYC